MLRGTAAAATLVALVSVSGCSGGDTGADRDPTPSSSGSSAGSSSTSPSAPSSSANTTDPSSGSASATAPQTAALDWMPVPGSVDDAVTRSRDWTLIVTGNGSGWRLTGPDGGGNGTAPAGWRVSDTLLDDDWSVVVLQDKSEEKPGRARVTDLATGKAFELDGRSDVPTTNGGTWALGEGRLLHATVRRGDYCLASVDLTSQRSKVAWCAPKRHGFSDAHVTRAGDSLLVFNAGHPSCRTVSALANGRTTAFPGVEECHGWDGVLTDDGAVWSVVPRESQVESAHFYARAGDQTADLGPGTSGSLVWCGDAAYFTRDPQRDGAPAALMRWNPGDGLSAAYETGKGQAFLEPPRCGGSAITVTARTSRGDAQVTADLS